MKGPDIHASFTQLTLSLSLSLSRGSFWLFNCLLNAEERQALKSKISMVNSVDSNLKLEPQICHRAIIDDRRRLQFYDLHMRSVHQVEGCQLVIVLHAMLGFQL